MLSREEKDILKNQVLQQFPVTISLYNQPSDELLIQNFLILCGRTDIELNLVRNINTQNTSTSLTPKNLSSTWVDKLYEEFTKPYWKELNEFLSEERSNFNVFPPDDEIFSAFNLCAFNDIKAVIVGQDPYFQINQAQGLCFSVRKGIKIPPSLNNIYKELESDQIFPPFKRPNHGCLIEWAERGVFLLNATLTVREGSANSHSNNGWEMFTSSVIKKINDELENVVFILWGKNAQSCKHLLDDSKHLILMSNHPSPLAGKGFNGCKHFSQTNNYLVQHSKIPIDWSLD